MEATSIAALVIILGLIYWANSRSQEKAATTSSEKAAKNASDERMNLRREAIAVVSSRAKKFDIQFSAEELDWICDEVEAESGKEGLQQVIEKFGKAGDKGNYDTVREQFESIKSDYRHYLIDAEQSRQKVETERQWQVVLEDFKKLNPAQQKTHLAYIKKNTDELTKEQLHVLELISLGEQEHSSSKDVMVGGIKLFTLKEK